MKKALIFFVCIALQSALCAQEDGLCGTPRNGLASARSNQSDVSDTSTRADTQRNLSLRVQELEAMYADLRNALAVRNIEFHAVENERNAFQRNLGTHCQEIADLQVQNNSLQSRNDRFRARISMLQLANNDQAWTRRDQARTIRTQAQTVFNQANIITRLTYELQQARLELQLAHGQLLQTFYAPLLIPRARPS